MTWWLPDHMVHAIHALRRTNGCNAEIASKLGLCLDDVERHVGRDTSKVRPEACGNGRRVDRAPRLDETDGDEQ